MLKPTLITFFAFLGWYSHAQRITSEDVQLEKADTKNLGYRQLSGKVEMRAHTGNIETFMIDSGAGSKQLRSTDGNEIIVKAVIELSTNNSDKAGEIIDENLTLELKKDGDKVTLTSLFDFDKGGNNVTKGSFFKAPERRVNLEIYIPKGLFVKLKDRSGEVSIKGLTNDLKINDGSGGLYIDGLDGSLDLVDHSGELRIKNVNWESEDPELRTVKVLDHSGELILEKVAGDLSIKDYSGEIILKKTKGPLSINDTSGGISVRDHVGDSRVDDASGEITISKIDGSVTLWDTSGGISVTDATKDVHLKRDGSGEFYTSKIQGTVKKGR